MPRRPVEPVRPAIYRLHVVRSERVTPSFQRVTLGGEELARFGWMGHDQWFRLFMLQPGQTELRLPTATSSRMWYPQYLAIPEKHRPHLANYTVRAYRADERELDVDFVVHRGPSGEVEGRAAIWSVGARPGEPVGLLDQGLLFNPPPAASEVHVIADESGVPAAVGVLESLDRSARGRAVLEVPEESDRQQVDAPAGVEIRWVIRAQHAPGSVPGTAALADLRRGPLPDRAGYGFVVGESALATEGRRTLVAAGLPKSRITFCGFWKH